MGSIEALYGADSATAAQARAEYIYSSYGEIMMKSGDLADKNNITYSTRYKEANTGLVSYTYRHYSPRLKKWINKDPIAEQGGVNLYQMVGNQPVNYWDLLGLSRGTETGIFLEKLNIKSYIKDVLNYECLGVIIVAHGIDGKYQCVDINGTANEVLHDLQSFALKNGRNPGNLGLGAVSCNDVLSNKAAGIFEYPNENRTDKNRNNALFNIHISSDAPDNLRAALTKEINAFKNHAKKNMCKKQPGCCKKIHIKIFTILIDQGSFLANWADAINYFNRNYPFLKDNYEYDCDEL